MRPHALLAALLASQAVAGPPPESPPPQSPNPHGLPNRNDFLAAVVALFPADIPVTTSCSVITNSEVVLGELFGIDDTVNDPCGDVTMIWVRGTCNSGNTGVLVGPWIIQALREKLSSQNMTLGAIGFEYPATVEDYLAGSKHNGVLLAEFIHSLIDKCPNTSLVLAGHSQGAMVIQQAAEVVDPADMEPVVAVVLYGDPFNEEPVANIDPSNVKKYCNPGDDICIDGILITPAHLVYADDADDSADFILSRLKTRR